MGIVQNFKGLFVARFFLGVAGKWYPSIPFRRKQTLTSYIEGGLYPGIVYYITTWYRREEAQFRQALMFGSASLAGAFSGILAFGIGVSGLSVLVPYYYVFWY